MSSEYINTFPARRPLRSTPCHRFALYFTNDWGQELMEQLTSIVL